MSAASWFEFVVESERAIWKETRIEYHFPECFFHKGSGVRAPKRFEWQWSAQQEQCSLQRALSIQVVTFTHLKRPYTAQILYPLQDGPFHSYTLETGFHLIQMHREGQKAAGPEKQLLTAEELALRRKLRRVGALFPSVTEPKLESSESLTMPAVALKSDDPFSNSYLTKRVIERYFPCCNPAEVVSGCHYESPFSCRECNLLCLLIRTICSTSKPKRFYLKMS